MRTETNKTMPVPGYLRGLTAAIESTGFTVNTALLSQTAEQEPGDGSKTHVARTLLACAVHGSVRPRWHEITTRSHAIVCGRPGSYGDVNIGNQVRDLPQAVVAGPGKVLSTISFPKAQLITSAFLSGDEHLLNLTAGDIFADVAAMLPAHLHASRLDVKHAMFWYLMTGNRGRKGRPVSEIWPITSDRVTEIVAALRELFPTYTRYVDDVHRDGMNNALILRQSNDATGYALSRVYAAVKHLATPVLIQIGNGLVVELDPADKDAFKRAVASVTDQPLGAVPLTIDVDGFGPNLAEIVS